MKKYLILFLALALAVSTQAQIISTIAGDGGGGYNGDNIPATTARLEPNWPAVDAKGNVYIAEVNGRIRKVDTAGIITTFAGTGTVGYSGDGGPATSAQIGQPYGIILDSIGNIYFADWGNHTIRKIDTFGIITTIGGTGIVGSSGDNGPATSAALVPMDIAFDRFGNMYLTDIDGGAIRKISTSGIITHIAGNGTHTYSGDNGPASVAGLARPIGIAVDAIGNIYFSDETRVRKIDTSGIITTIAGTDTCIYSGDNGPAIAAQLCVPKGIAIDGSGSLLISDWSNNRIRKIDTLGIITTIAGDDSTGNDNGDGGPATAATIGGPEGITIDRYGNIFFADYYYVRKISAPPLAVITVTTNTVAGITLYPNPASAGYIMLAVSSALTGPASIHIVNDIGQKVLETSIQTNAPVSLPLNIPPGIYFLSATTAQGTYSKPLIVK